ncbi:MAG: class II glutamine amidotransferase [Pseudomonadales bacterium]|nr:class II glutamine amidotransferase [Pseudomonadales bacterium]
MCELLGMSASVPTDICFSFAGLMRRGGATGPHRDGWGMAFYEGAGYRAFHDPGASADSEIARFMQSYSIKSTNVICHIRKANRGRVCLENTHPFSRELWGKVWTFAHNGQLKGIKKRPLNFYQVVGTTDSEYAFCWLLDQIRQRFPKGQKNPKTLQSFIRELISDLSSLGVFNILMSDSAVLYAHCSTSLHWLTRRAPFGEAKLLDADIEVNFADHTTPDDVVTVVATEPLTSNENWQKMASKELRVFKLGQSVGMS